MAEGKRERRESSSEESVKLFVGQVPKNMTEVQLLTMFREFALVDEVNIIKDKTTRASRGCCFVICPTREEADKAVNACHNKKTLSGASSPLQVKYADGELERLEHKLFVGMLPKNVSEAEVSTLFSTYGTIKDLQILRGSQQTSKGCAFLKYETEEQAIAALDAINGKHKMEGSSVPLVVKWADTKKGRQAWRAQKAQSQASNVPTTDSQHPSLFGASPLGYVPPNNGFGFQDPGYELMQYRLPPMQNQPGFHSMIPTVNQGNAWRGIAPDLGSSMNFRSYSATPASYMGSAYDGLHQPLAYPGGLFSHRPLSSSLRSVPPAVASSNSATSWGTGKGSGGQVEDLNLTGLPESFFAEEGNEKQILLPPQRMVFDTEAVEMTSNSSKRTKSEIEVIEDEASQRWPEGLLDEEMQQEAISTLKPQGVFDVEAVKMPESGGQMKSQIADKEMEPEADRPQEAQQFLMQVGLRLTEPPKDEDWENANEIYLMDNELSVLPENPRCPKLSALFLQRNYKLRLIPPAFFDYMPALQILNLSGTNIKSLPNSIIRLVSLKRLFLNDCHCFMVLSPKIGELKQLEVLSLEGTEIMDLPLDIKKLTNLTCLEVSFCEFQSNCRQAMQLNAVVPCGVISVLSQLEELNIDVDPGDERWDACVEDIVNEVCTLKRLYSLKFYFQRVELLSHIQQNIPSLLYFRFTVGRHLKRIMSGVPHDVELELERWDRCLKYINGVDVPEDIKEVLQHSTAFFLDRHATVKKLSNFGIENMEKLKCLVMAECSEVQVIIDDSNEIAPKSYGTEKIVLGSLEYMYVYYMESLRSMWEGPLQPDSLACLKSLTLCTCPQLTTIFTPGLLANLCNLKELNVDDCCSIKSIVSRDAEQKGSYFLPELKKISLHYVPELDSISNGLHIAPKLEWLSFYDCPKLKNPLVGEVSTQCLKGIKGEMSWWKALEWSNGRPAHMDEIFVLIDIGDC